MKTTIHSNDFLNLLRCLSLLKCICANVDIKGGILRQKSNDEYSIIEMDLTSLVSDCNILIPDIKGKLPILKELAKQDVKITSIDNHIIFSGERSTIKFNNPPLDFLDNKFIPDQEMTHIFTLREEDVVLEYPINQEASNLMKVISGQFKIVSFQVLFEGDTASIVATTTSKDQYSRIENGIPIKTPLKGFSNVVAEPFFLDHDGEILFKMYKVEDAVCVNKFKTLVGKITVVVYGRSQLVEEDE